MGELIACRGCRRHVRAGDERCPFCASSTSGSRRAWPLAVIELGLAATASVGLAACYGAPPRLKHHDGPPSPRDQHAFRVPGEPGGRARATANARVQGCDVNGGTVLVAQCGSIELRIQETESGALDVTCSGAPEADCRALVDSLVSPPAPKQ